jgi:hypothetical protein
MLTSRESHKKIFATPVDKRTHRDTIRDPSTGNGIEPICWSVEGQHECICGKRLQAFLSGNAVVFRRQYLRVFFDK